MIVVDVQFFLSFTLLDNSKRRYKKNCRHTFALIGGRNIVAETKEQPTIMHHASCTGLL